MPTSPIPVRSGFLVIDKEGKMTNIVSWEWLKWLMEGKVTPPPFDPDSLVALTIEEPPAVSIQEDVASQAALSSQLDSFPLRREDMEEIAATVALATADASANASTQIALVEDVGLVIDGNGAVPATGDKGVRPVPFNCSILEWTLIADQAGDCQITISAGSYSAFPVVSSIVAAAPPSMTGVQKNTNAVLTGWSRYLPAGTILQFNLDSVATCTRIMLQLKVVRS